MAQAVPVNLNGVRVADVRLRQEYFEQERNASCFFLALNIHIGRRHNLDD
jgi:hypothetical protein